MEKILVTGGEGFIGSHLVEMLLEIGFRVKSLCLYNSFSDIGWLAEIRNRSNLEIVFGDVRDPKICDQITQDVDGIFHLAALIAIPYSYMAPRSYIDTNIIGTQNICDSALKNNVKKLITMSTSEVYGTAQKVPMSEEHPLQAQSPYSASKIAADSIAYSYCTSFGLPLTIARPFNTFGPRQSRRAIIPTIISQFLSGMDEIHVGEIQSTRDLTFVTDTCRGLIDLYKKSYFNGEIYNIGSNSEYSISQIIEEVSKYFKRNLPIVQKNERMRPKKSEVMRLVCDYSKINSLSGFTPQVTLQRGISETCQWMSQSHINAALQQNSYGI